LGVRENNQRQEFEEFGDKPNGPQRGEIGLIAHEEQTHSGISDQKSKGVDPDYSMRLLSFASQTPGLGRARIGKDEKKRRNNRNNWASDFPCLGWRTLRRIKPG